MPREMRDMRLTVGDFASPAQEGRTNPCVMGCAHLYLGSLFVFGEGMGGSEGGRVEGRLAVSAVLANFRNAEIDDPHERLAAALSHSADVLRARSRSVSAFTDAWAQAVAVLVRKNRLFAVRCGNVKLLLVRKGQVRDLFANHEAGAGANTGDSDSSLLGQADMPRIEVLPGEIPLEAGDRFLLSNAPLATAVPLNEVARYVSSFVPAVAARRLVEAADQSSRKRPVSVQIVQSGEAPSHDFRTEEPIRPRLEPSHGAAALLARSKPTPRVDLRSTLPSWTPPNSSIEATRDLDQSSDGRTLDGSRWTWLAGIAAVVLIALGMSSWLSSDPTPEEDVVADATEAVAPTTIVGVTADSFWERIESDSIPSAREIRDWAGDNAGRRLAEARAVVAALEAIPSDGVTESAKDMPSRIEVAEGLPEDAPFEDIQRGEPSEAAAPGSHPPPKEPDAEVAEDIEAPLPIPAKEIVDEPQKPSPEKPAALPRRVRAFDRIFRIRNSARAGETLRNYIHRRHARADKVLARLGEYVNLVPKEKTIPVLRNALKHRPGPKTRRWLRRTLKKLRS